MKFKNLTPHDINLKVSGGEILTIPSEGVARINSSPGKQLDSLIWSSPVWGEVEGLPPPEDGVLYIVSALVAAQCIGREDVASPGTGPNDGCIRNEKGQIVAVTRLIQAPQK